MDPAEIPERARTPYHLALMPGAEPKFEVVPLWTDKAHPEIMIDDDEQPILMLKVRAQQLSYDVVLHIALTAKNRAQLVELLQQAVHVDEIRGL
jgi:hypothetical protein